MTITTALSTLSSLQGRATHRAQTMNGKVNLSQCWERTLTAVRAVSTHWCMCGLFAVVGHSLTDAALETVFRTLKHRGPDGRGVFTEPTVPLTLVQTRLAVIDLATGAQPISSEDGEIVLVCNGEIYDFEKIRSSLEAKGHCFKTKSDSEVIIYLYREFGLGCFEYLRGEFAFLLYDKHKNLLIAARDRFGIKPLYFSRLSGGVVFGSEMKAVFASGLVAPKLNVTSFDPLLEQDPDDVGFPFKDIEHVPPASYATIDLNTLDVSLKRYWSAEIPDQSAEPVTEPLGDAPEKYAQLVLRKLEEAVRLRLRADVPVGLYLSGGVDSAFVAALMQRSLKSALHSFSISFQGSEKSEQHFARRAADVLGTTHHELTVTKQALWDHLEDCLWFSELPFVTLAPVGKFLLSKEARKHVTVVLTGEGADEVFLGYRSFFQRAIKDTRHARQENGRASPRARRLKLGGLLAPLVRMLSLLIFHKNHRRDLAMARRTGVDPLPAKPVINIVQEGRIAAMPTDILCYLGDREEMAHSLEARLPFLDHKLYDAAKQIPVDFKMRDGIEKAVLRDAAKDILPEDLRLRRKRGFMLTSDPVDLFGDDLESSRHLRHHLSKETFARVQIFSYRAYRVMSVLARMPARKQIPALGRLRRDANKVLMYMMQTHMLHHLFIAEPRWQGE